MTHEFTIGQLEIDDGPEDLTINGAAALCRLDEALLEDPERADGVGSLRVVLDDAAEAARLGCAARLASVVLSCSQLTEIELDLCPHKTAVPGSCQWLMEAYLARALAHARELRSLTIVRPAKVEATILAEILAGLPNLLELRAPELSVCGRPHAALCRGYFAANVFPAELRLLQLRVVGASALLILTTLVTQSRDTLTHVDLTFDSSAPDTPAHAVLDTLRPLFPNLASLALRDISHSNRSAFMLPILPLAPELHELTLHPADTLRASQDANLTLLLQLSTLFVVAAYGAEPCPFQPGDVRALAGRFEGVQRLVIVHSPGRAPWTWGARGDLEDDLDGDGVVLKWEVVAE